MPKTSIEQIKQLNLKYMVANQKNLGEVVKSLDILLSIANEIEVVADKLQASGFKEASTALQSLVKQVTDLPAKLQQVQVKSDKTLEVVGAVKELTSAVQAQKLDPHISVDPTPVKINLQPLVDSLDDVKQGIKGIEFPETHIDLDKLESAVKEVTKTIKSLSFPAPNYILPFKNTNGAATQVQLDSDGKLPVLIAATVATKETQPATPTLANVTMTGSSVTLQASNTDRRNLMIFNDSGVTVYVKLGTSASSTSFTVNLVNQAYYELPSPVYTGIVTALGASGDVRVTEVV